MLSNYLYLIVLLLLVSCGGIESEKIDIDDAKNSSLLVPPCIQK